MNLITSLRKKWKITLPVAAILVTALGLGIALSLGAFEGEAAPAPSPTATATPTPTVTEPVEAPEEDEAEEEEPEEEEDTPNLSIDWLNHMAYDPVWNPPDLGESFWQVVDPEHGYPETGGTRYILAHSCESRRCAGDLVIPLQEGDTFTLQGETYRVDDRFTTMKNDIASQPIWEHVEGRVVIVTCLIETSWQLSDKNEIVVASRI